ncbi:redoxin domain-containing protein [bacterium]|nr:redoxin domain-containing protein [bacterium]
MRLPEMLLSHGLSVLVLLGGLLAQGQAADSVLGEFQLQDFRGRTWKSTDFDRHKVLVVASYGVECPLAKLYAPRLQQLADAYKDQGVGFVVIDANRHDSLTEMAAFARDHQWTMPFLKDLNNQLADRLQAERTPEVFVLDADHQVKYRGRIDDQHSVGGHSRPAPTRDDLKLAIDDLLAGREVAVAKTEAVGCIIGRVRPPKPEATITFAEHVAPLLNARCVECHREGEIGPFSLQDYDEVAGWAPMIAEVTREHRMPPWHASPQHGHFANENRLTDAEIQMLQDWSRAGAPAGDLTKLPPTPEFITGWQLPHDPDLVVAMSKKPFQVPATGEVKYQYFSVDPGITEDKWVTAAEVVPGNRAIVHHVIVFAAPGGKVENEDGQLLIAYVPGMRILPLPKGFAKRLPAGSKLIFQLHYTPNGTPQEDLTKVGLTFADESEVEYEVQTASTRNRKFEILPLKADQQFTSKTITAPTDLLLLSMSPHMHLRGQSFRYEMVWPNGQTETLLDVPAYDFNWQMSYRLKEPMAVPQGSKLTAFAKFDNSRENLANPDPTQTVLWGDQSWEEMLIGYFDIAIPRKADETMHIAADLRQQGTNEEVASRILKRVDQNGDGKIQKSELVNPRFAKAFPLADTNSDGEISLEELTALIPLLRR